MDHLTFAMYQANILEHNKHPHNKGPLLDSTFSHRHRNPACGDAFELSIKIKDNKIVDAKFEGVGCAVSTASMSLFTDFVKGKSIDEVRAMTKETIFELLGIPITPGREVCALLSLKTIQEGIKNHYE
jgi:nitrogen fixation NifU-like protein